MNTLLKMALPDKKVVCPILRGPFRGARICLNPRHSLRKIFGIYEHELNGWLRRALPKVNTVIDVGANDGYFTFGCWAAFRRQHRAGTIFAFEPGSEAFDGLQQTQKLQSPADVALVLERKFVGSAPDAQTTTLDELWNDARHPSGARKALIKIDVEGAEFDLLQAATKWMTPGHLFVIEVHRDELLGKIRALFARQQLPLWQIDQRPLPLLGRERREMENRWLVSAL